VADDNDPKKTGSYEQRETRQISSEQNGERAALTYVGDQLVALVEEIQAQGEATAGEYRRDRVWQRVFAVGTLLVSLLTLWVLFKTYGIYSKIQNVESQQATIMGTQTVIMNKQREITEKTLPALQEQARAASTQAAASLVNAQAAAHSAEEAHKSNEQAMRIFQEEDAARLDLEVQASEFGTEHATAVLIFRNTGKRGAKEFSLRCISLVVPRDMQNYRQISLLPEPQPIDQRVLQASIQEDRTNMISAQRLMSRMVAINKKFSDEMAKMLDPALPFNFQAPVLPPESVFLSAGRDAVENMNEIRTLASEYWTKKRGYPFPFPFPPSMGPTLSTPLPTIAPNVTRVVSMAEIGPGMPATSQCEVPIKSPATLDDLRAKKAALYVVTLHL